MKRKRGKRSESMGKHKESFQEKYMKFMYKNYQKDSNKETSTLDTTPDDFKNDKNINSTPKSNLKQEFKAAKQRAKLSKVRPQKRKKKRKHVFLKITCLVILLAIIGGTIFFVPYLTTAINSYNSGFDTSRIDIEKVPYIYDKDGNLISVMYGYYDNQEEGFVPTYSSVYTDINSLPKHVGDAFTAIEDETFYENMGISFNRLLYAIFNYMLKGDSSFGGSTITQQLVKVATGDSSHSASRKAREIGSALYLTDNWSKHKILASYMNLVYYGNGAYGIYEASMTYFDCEPKDLNIAQAAVLASIPNSPDFLNPYGENTQERLFRRQKLVLAKMKELNLINEDQYNEAIAFEIQFKNGSSKIAKNDPALKPYLDVAVDDAIKTIQESYNCSYEDAKDILFRGKVRIYTNLDVDYQKKVYEIAKSNYTDVEGFELGGVITNKEGGVIAMIPSRQDSHLNHAYRIRRQTGSAIKPLSVYGPAYDMGILQPSTTVYDVPVSIKTATGTWNVHNASNTFRGAISTNDAIAYSLNTVAVTTLEKVGIAQSYEYLKSWGITSIDNVNDMYYPCLALGGLYNGISPFEMTQAYNAISNNGNFKKASTIAYVMVEDKKIEVNKNEHQVISPEAAGKLKESLNAVSRYGTGRTAVVDGHTTYLKTGTTNDVKDIWTCGFTDEITFCLWGGFDNPKHIPLWNVNAVWKQSMDYYYQR